MSSPPKLASESWASYFQRLTPAHQRAFLATLTPQETTELGWAWWWWGRPAQQPPAGAWSTWLILAGRGWGKSRTGAQTVIGRVQDGTAKRIALVARTAGDVRDVVVEGESGILAVSPPHFRPTYEPSKRRLTWPNGAVATTFSADQPDALRGPQSDFAWCDELASWPYEEAWSNLRFGLRLGDHPACVVTTTPRPTKLIRELLADPATAVTRGSTYDNRPNLAPGFFDAVIRRYEGTRLGRQELNAELLDDAPGALWHRDALEALRVARPPTLARVVIALDPAVTSHATSDETGLVVAGLGDDGEGYVLEDASGRYSPDGWARKAVELYTTHQADRIVAEVNNGGELVEHTLRTVAPKVPYKALHASRGKRTRAEPVAALYEQARVHHVGTFPALEDQLCSWEPASAEASPDRLDALVWALTELMVRDGPPRAIGAEYLYE